MSKILDQVPGLVGAAVGGVLGYFAYEWGLQQRLKAGVVPGALLGLGSGFLSIRPSRSRGIVCGLAALALGLYVEWHFFPFVRDEGLAYFLTHVHRLPPLVLVMIALGTFLGYRWGGDGFRPGPAGKPSLDRSGLD